MIQVGQRLGRYRLLEPLGSGGMSVVYRGRDVALERDVAVKVLHPHLATDGAARERFAREARAVARLHHPGIVEVYDVSDPAAPDAYLVTEYIRGVTLKELFASTRFQVPEAAALIAHAVAAALAHAHHAQVLHRDVKPENVMVRREDGRVKLMDFGIAKVFDRDERMTQTGTLVGSPAHMAPEIIEGKEAHFPSDVFSVGTLLYLALTGELPFQAPNTSALLQRIVLGEYADPRTRNAAIPDPLVEVVNRCLARSPQDRYPDAGALHDALASVLTRAGLSDPQAELQALLADPAAFQLALTERLTTARHEHARKLLAEGRVGPALAELNLLLALAPQHPQGRVLLASLRLRQRRRRRWRRLGIGTAATVAVALVAWVGLRPLRALPALGAGAPLAQRLISARRAERPHTALVPGAPRLLPSPAQPHPPAAAAALPPAPAPPPAPLAVSVLIRPYGYLRADGRPVGTEALARHALQLAPGVHQLTVSCDFCADVTEEIDVRPGEDNVFRLRAQLKPAELAFRFQPVDARARVRVGDDERDAGDTAEHPFQIESPRGPPTFRHRVEYEVSAQGFKTMRRTVYLEPGKRTLVEGTLDRS